MPEFILPTEGAVELPADYKGFDYRGFGVDRALTWADLDAFTQGYIEALFFTENEPGTTREEMLADLEAWCEQVKEGRQSEIPGDYGFADLAPEALLEILTDCAEFQASDVWKDRQHSATGMPDDAQAGRDFWYTRNGHGCGFWDGDWPEPYGADLSKAARAFGEVDACIGTDHKVYLS